MRKTIQQILTVLTLAAFLSACGGTAASAEEAKETNTIVDSEQEETVEEEILIHLSDKGSASDGEGVSISGSTVTITAAGTYRLDGSLSDGQIRVDAGDEARVKLILDGVSVSKEGSAAIYALSADKVILSAASGSVNSLSSTGEYVQTDDNTVDAAVFAKCDLNLNGKGTVDVSSETGHGVVSKDDLKVKGGTWNVTAAGKGLSGKDSVSVEDGEVNIVSGTKGIWSDNDEDEEKGNIEILGGGVTVNSQDDSIHSGNTVTISCGTLSLSSGDDGIHADNTLSISGGEIAVLKSYEGLEANDIDISGGVISIVASDDGINAAGGNDGSGSFGPFGGDHFGSDSGSTLTISGGILTVDAGGDGLDANGELNVSGGEVYVNGPTNSGNGALDYGTGASISGGTVIAVGAAGMAANFGSDSTQGSIMINLSSAQAAGTTVSVVDENGKVLASFTPAKSYQNVVISAEGMVQGGTYTITAGTESQTITLDSLIYGSGMGMGGPGGMGQRGEGEFGGQMGGRGGMGPRGEGGFGGRMGGPNGQMGEFQS